MSVMACSRYECIHILCERLILCSSRYICDECYTELLQYKASWPVSLMLVDDVRDRINTFLTTSPGTYSKSGSKDIDAEFTRLTT